MTEPILEFLIRFMKALHVALLGVVKRRTTPPPGEQRGAYTDQW